MNIETIIRQLDFNLAYARKLVEDVDETQMTFSPCKGLENHPAFTLGHLVTGSAMTANYLGGTYNIPKSWDEIFRRNGPGDPRLPEEEASKYPSKDALLSELENQHNQIKTQLQKADLASLEKPQEWRFSRMLPTQMDCTVFMCITHEAMHLGQLASWRRAMDLPSALGNL